MSTPHPSISRIRKKNRRRRIGVILVVILVLPLLGFLLTAAWTFSPQTDEPRRSEVLLVLGPVDARMAEAEEFMESGRADTLLLAVSQEDPADYPEWCDSTENYEVLCFNPEPHTTQGEAIALRDYAEEFGWESASVMTVGHHITRSRVIIDRCYEGDLFMVEADGEGLWGSWWDTYAYQTAGLAKAIITPGCTTELPDGMQRWSERLKRLP